MKKNYSAITSQAVTCKLDKELESICGQPTAEAVFYSTSDKTVGPYTSIQLGISSNTRILYAKKDGVFTTSMEDFTDFVKFVESTGYLSRENWEFFWSGRGYEIKDTVWTRCYDYNVPSCKTCKYAVQRPIKDQQYRMFAPRLVCARPVSCRRQKIINLFVGIGISLHKFMESAEKGAYDISSYSAIHESIEDMQSELEKITDVIKRGYTEPYFSAGVLLENCHERKEG